MSSFRSICGKIIGLTRQPANELGYMVSSADWEEYFRIFEKNKDFFEASEFLSFKQKEVIFCPNCKRMYIAKIINDCVTYDVYSLEDKTLDHW